jgi:hypothetical protein
MTNGNGFTRPFLIHFQKNVNIYSLNVYVVNLKWKFIYLGRRPSLSPLLSPDVLADVDVVDLKLSIDILETQYFTFTLKKIFLQTNTEG